MSKHEKSDLDKQFESGYRRGRDERPDYKSLRERYIYLKLGGSWDMLTTGARETYLAGFEDAMKTLGVKP